MLTGIKWEIFYSLIFNWDDSYDGSLSSPSSTLEETNANYKNYNTLKNSNPSSEINLIDIIKYLSLSIAIILAGFIIYKRLKNRIATKKKWLFKKLTSDFIFVNNGILISVNWFIE